MHDEQALPTFAHGVELHMAPGTETGYKGVRRTGKRYQARTSQGKQEELGTFDTAVEADREMLRAHTVAGVRGLRTLQGLPHRP